MARINKNKRFIRDPRYRIKMKPEYKDVVFLVDYKVGSILTPWKLKLDLKPGESKVITADPAMEIRVRHDGEHPTRGPLYSYSYTYRTRGGQYIGTSRGPKPPVVIRSAGDLTAAYSG